MLELIGYYIVIWAIILIFVGRKDADRAIELGVKAFFGLIAVILISIFGD